FRSLIGNNLEALNEASKVARTLQGSGLVDGWNQVIGRVFTIEQVRAAITRSLSGVSVNAVRRAVFKAAQGAMLQGAAAAEVAESALAVGLTTEEGAALSV
ncbi:14270_t:CDS:2, partial [Racocetra fulgida]